MSEAKLQKNVPIPAFNLKHTSEKAFELYLTYCQEIDIHQPEEAKDKIKNIQLVYGSFMKTVAAIEKAQIESKKQKAADAIAKAKQIAFEEAKKDKEVKLYRPKFKLSEEENN